MLYSLIANRGRISPQNDDGTNVDEVFNAQGSPVDLCHEDPEQCDSKQFHEDSEQWSSKQLHEDTEQCSSKQLHEDTEQCSSNQLHEDPEQCSSKPHQPDLVISSNEHWNAVDGLEKTNKMMEYVSNCKVKDKCAEQRKDVSVSAVDAAKENQIENVPLPFIDDDDVVVNENKENTQLVPQKDAFIQKEDISDTESNTLLTDDSDVISNPSFSSELLSSNSRESEYSSILDDKTEVSVAQSNSPVRGELASANTGVTITKEMPLAPKDSIPRILSPTEFLRRKQKDFASKNLKSESMVQSNTSPLNDTDVKIQSKRKKERKRYYANDDVCSSSSEDEFPMPFDLNIKRPVYKMPVKETIKSIDSNTLKSIEVQKGVLDKQTVEIAVHTDCKDKKLPNESDLETESYDKGNINEINKMTFQDTSHQCHNIEPLDMCVKTNDDNQSLQHANVSVNLRSILHKGPSATRKSSSVHFADDEMEEIIPLKSWHPVKIVDVAMLSDQHMDGDIQNVQEQQAFQNMINSVKKKDSMPKIVSPTELLHRKQKDEASKSLGNSVCTIDTVKAKHVSEKGGNKKPRHAAFDSNEEYSSSEDEFPWDFESDIKMPEEINDVGSVIKKKFKCSDTCKLHLQGLDCSKYLLDGDEGTSSGCSHSYMANYSDSPPVNGTRDAIPKAPENSMKSNHCKSSLETADARQTQTDKAEVETCDEDGYLPVPDTSETSLALIRKWRERCKRKRRMDKIVSWSLKHFPIAERLAKALSPNSSEENAKDCSNPNANENEEATTYAEPLCQHSPTNEDEENSTESALSDTESNLLPIYKYDEGNKDGFISPVVDQAKTVISVLKEFLLLVNENHDSESYPEEYIEELTNIVETFSAKFETLEQGKYEKGKGSDIYQFSDDLFVRLIKFEEKFAASDSKFPSEVESSVQELKHSRDSFQSGDLAESEKCSERSIIVSENESYSNDRRKSLNPNEKKREVHSRSVGELFRWKTTEKQSFSDNAIHVSACAHNIADTSERKTNVGEGFSVTRNTFMDAADTWKQSALRVRRDMNVVLPVWVGGECSEMMGPGLAGVEGWGEDVADEGGLQELMQVISGYSHNTVLC